MPPYADRPTVHDVLGRHGFEQVLAIPAVPVVAGSPIRYGETVTVAPGDQPWYVRGFGTGFTVLGPRWVRGGLTRVYSVDGGVLLGQAVTDTRTAATALGTATASDLVPLVGRWAAEVAPAERGWSLTIAATVPDPGPRTGARVGG